jgi:hypothetical protein
MLQCIRLFALELKRRSDEESLANKMEVLKTKELLESELEKKLFEERDRIVGEIKKGEREFFSIAAERITDLVSEISREVVADELRNAPQTISARILRAFEALRMSALPDDPESGFRSTLKIIVPSTIGPELMESIRTQLPSSIDVTSEGPTGANALDGNSAVIESTSGRILVCPKDHLERLLASLDVPSTMQSLIPWLDRASGNQLRDVNSEDGASSA